MISRHSPRPPLPPNLISIRTGRRVRRNATIAWVALRARDPADLPPNWAAMDIAERELGSRPAWAVGVVGLEDGRGGLVVRRRTRRGVVVVRGED